MSDGGKGSVRRPKQISDKEEQARWDAIFGKKKPKQTETPVKEHKKQN